MLMGSSFIVYTFYLYMFISAAFPLLLNGNGLVEGTNIKWTPNANPDAPEAATAPRSQKYWDENNIEKPEYAKTDFEVMKEKLQKATGRSDSNDGDGRGEKTSLVSLGLIVVFFVILWIVILRIGMGSGLGFMGIGKRQGVNRLGGGSLSSSLGNRTRKGAPFGRWGGNASGQEEKARIARLARFETKKDS